RLRFLYLLCVSLPPKLLSLPPRQLFANFESPCRLYVLVPPTNFFLYLVHIFLPPSHLSAAYTSLCRLGISLPPGHLSAA
ncbi:MAG: hypothetical protein ACK56I_25490, partial [bacterium]